MSSAFSRIAYAVCRLFMILTGDYWLQQTREGVGERKRKHPLHIVCNLRVPFHKNLTVGGKRRGLDKKEEDIKLKLLQPLVQYIIMLTFN